MTGYAPDVVVAPQGARLVVLALSEGRGAYDAGRHSLDPPNVRAMSRHLDVMSLCMRRLIGDRDHESLCLSLGLHSASVDHESSEFGGHEFPVLSAPVVRAGVLAFLEVLMHRDLLVGPDADRARVLLEDLVAFEVMET